VLDDYSRYIIAWKLCSTMRAEDVTDTLDLALAASGCDQAHVHHRPRLLSDNGPSFIAGELADYIKAQRMSHVRRAPFHPRLLIECKHSEKRLGSRRFFFAVTSWCYRYFDGRRITRPRTIPALTVLNLELLSYNSSMVDEVARIVGARIRDLREKTGMSLRGFAEHGGLNYNVLSRIERGEQNLTLATLFKIAGLLKTTPARLLRGLPASLS